MCTGTLSYLITLFQSEVNRDIQYLITVKYICAYYFNGSSRLLSGHKCWTRNHILVFRGEYSQPGICCQERAQDQDSQLSAPLKHQSTGRLEHYMKQRPDVHEIKV